MIEIAVVFANFPRRETHGGYHAMRYDATVSSTWALRFWAVFGLPVRVGAGATLGIPRDCGGWARPGVACPARPRQNSPMARILLFGQAQFGQKVFEELLARGHEITAVCPPPDSPERPVDPGRVPGRVWVGVGLALLGLNTLRWWGTIGSPPT